MNCTIHVAKTKALLICAFGFAYADSWFPHEAARLILKILVFHTDCYVWSKYARKELLIGDSVSGLGGFPLAIKCDINVQGPCTLAFTYTRGVLKYRIYGGFYIVNRKSLATYHAGNYTVTCTGGNRTIQLDVLYPPGEADIRGPYTIEKGSPLNLTCEADCNPPARYWWKYDLSEDSPVIATGATITLPALQHEDTWLHCFAQNTMASTFDSTVTKPPIHVARHLVIKQDPAHIRDLPEEFTTYSGLTMSIYCNVGGIPTPTVWWTKEGDESFTQTGNRLTAVNVKTEFSGLYHCNAQNTVLQNGTDYTAIDSSAVFVQVTDPPGVHHVWSAVAAVGASVLVMSCIAIVVMCIKRKQKMAANRRADNESLVPPVQLSSIMSHDEPGSSGQNGPASNQPTENTCSSGSHQLHINHGFSSEETRRKSIDDTQVLYDVL